MTLASEHVLVVGAGPAGISSAYYLEQAGIAYRVVERAPIVASTWASLYPSLRLNTAGFVSHLPGQRIPLKYGMYPTGRDFYRYVDDYVKQHPFRIELGLEVKRVAPDGDQWVVETARDTGRYRCVIIASGRFGNPYLPPIPGADQFEGRYIHAHDYKSADLFAGQHVLVVGNGPSGVDIAVELSEVTPYPVLLAIRSDVVLARHYAFGLPITLWVLISERLPAKWRKPFMQRVKYRRQRDLSDLGITIAPNREDRVGTSAPVPESPLIEKIRSGALQPVKGLERLEGKCAILSDGSRHEVDTVIMSSGYRPMLNYLDIDYQTDSDGWPLRSDPRGTEIAGYPGLFLVGRYYRGLGPLNNVRHEAQVTVEAIKARLHGERSAVKLSEQIE